MRNKTVLYHWGKCFLYGRRFGIVVFLVFLASVSAWFSSYIYRCQASAVFSGAIVESASFRQMMLSEKTLIWLSETAAAGSMTCGEILTISWPFSENGCILPGDRMDQEMLYAWRKTFTRINRSGYDEVRNAFSAIWDDVECFPVTGTQVTYENSWMFERAYGGIRGHEGTDLIPPDNISGIYSVVSITDGTVENIGWLEQGGYRIGVRSQNGGYFYYAHLESYAQEFVIGDSVYAGELLGMMGDTGYGAEGTRGQFDVHLHLGIYIRTEQSEEISVNPYWILRYLQLIE